MALALLLALLVGTSLGLLGGGGSILTLPILVYVVGLDAKDGIASSLFVVGVTSAMAVIGHARRGNVRWGTGAIFGAASMTGAYLGGRLSRFVPSAYLLAGFTVVMLVTAFAMMRPRREADAVPVALRGAALARVLAVGVGIGLVTGFVGAGGGFVVVPALVLLCGLPMRAAVGTSLLVIAMNSIAGFAGTVTHATIPWTVVVLMTAAALVGSLGGTALAGRVSPAALRKGFAWFVLAMAALMIFKQASAHVSLLSLDTEIRGHMHAFTPGPALIGGGLIGLSASLFLLTHGKVAGISGLYAGALRRATSDRRMRVAFIAGLVTIGIALRAVAGSLFASAWQPTLPVAIGAGLLVGAGTRLGSGCTSGHGVCGLSRLSVRSLVATVAFMTTGFVTVYLVRHVLGGGR